MSKAVRPLGISVIVLAVICLVFGAIFLYQGFAKQSYIKEAMRAENITLGDLGLTGPEADQVIDSSSAAQLAGETVKAHRHTIAASYEELLGGKQYDPTNPRQLSYAQAINLENYLFLGVASLGLTEVALAAGGFMVFTALALGATGLSLMKLSG